MDCPDNDGPFAPWLDAQPDETGRAVYRFAARHEEQPLHLVLRLQGNSASRHGPTLQIDPPVPGCRLEVVDEDAAGTCRVCLTVGPAGPPAEDDELVCDLRDASNGAPSCRVVLRRTNCRISTALIERQPGDHPLRPQSRAALLWYAWRRYREVVGLKRFTSGKSGSDVLVFRPRLCEPAGGAPEGSVVPGVLADAWGSCLLVKTGRLQTVRNEWDRFQVFLADRLHPFMSRSEAYLTVLPANQREPQPPQATVIGSFLGGELLQAEPLEHLVRGSADAARCTSALRGLYSVLADWHLGGGVRPLREWRDIYQFFEDGRLKLFGQLDLSQEADRQRYQAPMVWDVAFIRKPHLRDHWLGKSDRRDGLLYRLMDWPVRFSLIHGDLHTRNVLVDQSNVWLLDFGGVGVGPTLFDFALLEVFLRLWCLDLSPRVKHFDEAAVQFESLLLDRLTGTERSLEPVRELAASLGTKQESLLTIAHCISEVRRQALRYGLGSPDRRDYLAVLYLTVLNALRFVGTQSDLAQNGRLLVSLAWVLEDVLSRIAGLEPFVRQWIPMQSKQLLSRRWLTDPDAPQRVMYLMNSESDRDVLEPLAATRGVLQSGHHHLDVFDHTLLVLAYVEQLLNDPLAGLLDPAGLDERVRADLHRQGISQPLYCRPLAVDRRPDVGQLQVHLEAIGRLLGETLDEDARSLLKWAALFHDVGKPATRRVNRAAGGESVQFAGHEAYGLQLVRDLLESLFAADCPQGHGAMRLEERTWICPRCDERLVPCPEDLFGRIELLIRRHHDHHRIVNRYVAHPERLAAVQQALDTRELPEGEWNYLAKFLDGDVSPHARDFPLLILHGFADLLSCRGPARTSDLLKVAEVDLLMLALWADFPQIKQLRQWSRRCAELTKGLDQEWELAGKAIGEVKRAVRSWYLAECRQAAEPTHEQVIQKIRELARSSPPAGPR